VTSADLRIAISRLHFPVTTLGPGRRLGLWFQGCSIRCAGCISADTWRSGSADTTLAQLLAQLAPWLQQADGVTISGGEPFDQPEALAALLDALPLQPQQDVLVYSGHPLERLQATAALRSGRIDALICDPYVGSAPQTLPLRGSDNQRLFLLTARGRERFAQYAQPLDERARALDLMFDDGGSVWLAGIPRPQDLQRLRALLQAQGHRITTSEAKTE